MKNTKRLDKSMESIMKVNGHFSRQMETIIIKKKKDR